MLTRLASTMISRSQATGSKAAAAVAIRYLSDAATAAQAASKSLYLYATGRNNKGQIGNGTTSDVKAFTRIDVGGHQPVTSFACGDKHTAATTADGTLWVWGSNSHGQLGLGHTQAMSSPTPVKALEGIRIVQVVCGRSHTAALSEHGHVYTWGRGGYDLEAIVIGPGCLGHGNRQRKLIPTVVDTLVPHTVTWLDSGDHHMCAKTQAGQMFMWGNGEYGRLGFGDSISYLTPQVLDTLPEASNALVSLGSSHSAAILPSGQLFTWGRNEQGQCGRSGGDVFSMDATPTVVSMLKDQKFARVSCGTGVTVALTNDNQVYIFGGRQFFSPTHLTNISSFNPVEIASGKMSILCLCEDGKLVVYGQNTYGQLGLGHTKTRREPEEIPDFESRVKQIRCGPAHSLLLAHD
eukprot:c4085_g1_i1.p1 GENE.c4085_g1_i1~~c4085_g1_i1.p1  ORF type:complete len:407 (-),score=98.53 c4085_g1_i1:226-1446(-)